MNPDQRRIDLQKQLVEIGRQALFFVGLFLVPYLFHQIYQPINESWTVKRFGCGCPPLDLSRQFNANDFNMILWTGILVMMLSSVIAACFRLQPQFRKRAILILVPFMFFACAQNFCSEVWL